MPTISTPTLVAVGAVLLVVAVLMSLHKNIATIIVALVISVALIYFVQQAAGLRLVNFSELGAFVMEYITRFIHWIQAVFWPKLASAAADIAHMF